MKSEKKLSIIIPCYNCEKTLLEAVESCYVQGFDIDEFEIVMVNDSSTDNTLSLMEKLSTEYKNIKIFSHVKNQGGGATRNTAITNSSSDIIFCLDSDDILPAQNLVKLYKQLIEKKLDGVLFAETRFFTTTIKKIEVVKNNPLHEYVELADIYRINAGFLNQVNFMYTKNAWKQIGGYPTNHGFDTQTFGLKFLAKLLKCQVCKDTAYFHRHHQKKYKSYYEREYEKGLLSINTLLSLEPIIDNLSDDVIEKIIRFDIFTKNYHGEESNLQSMISKYVQEGGKLISKQKQPDTLAFYFASLCTNIEQKDYNSALQNLANCNRIINTPTNTLLYMQIRIIFGLAKTDHADINEKTAEYLHQHNLLTKRKYKYIPTILKPIYTLYKFLTK